MIDSLNKLSKTLASSGFEEESDVIKKLSSKVSAKRAKGLNWNNAEQELLNSEVQPSKEAVQKLIASNPLLSPDNIQEILEVKIEDDFGKLLNKNEKIFIEIGAWANDTLNQINEVKDYLVSEGIGQPGDLTEFINNNNITELDSNNYFSIKAIFEDLNNAQLEWHEKARLEDQKNIGSVGYKTHDVVHEFEDGWVVVYVPAIGEGPSWKGNRSKSHDRTHEGNLLGLCLGESSGYYQDNVQGKIYSVRDPSNKPRVTIRMSEDRLFEAKGKNNLSPDIDAAIHADEWFRSLKVEYKSNNDYKSFPPLTIEDAEAYFTDENMPDWDKVQPYTRGWVSHWYGKGSNAIDSDVKDKISSNDNLIIYSGLAKKYKELAQPVVEYWAKKYIDEDSSTLFSQNTEGRWLEQYQLSHESWKTYKKDKWMQDAVEKLSRQNAEHFFKIGINRVNEYYDLAVPAAKEVADNDIIKFFSLKIHETHPEQGRPAMKKYAHERPYAFFEFEYHKQYPNVAGKEAVKIALKGVSLNPEIAINLLEDSGGEIDLFKDYTDDLRDSIIKLPDLSKFFKHNLNKIYPDLSEDFLEKMTSSDYLANSDVFFSDYIYMIDGVSQERVASAAKVWSDINPYKFLIWYQSLLGSVHLSMSDQNILRIKSFIKEIRELKIEVQAFRRLVDEDREMLQLYSKIHSDHFLRDEMIEGDFNIDETIDDTLLRSRPRGKKEKRNIKRLEKQLLENKDNVSVEEVVGFFDSLRLGLPRRTWGEPYDTRGYSLRGGIFIPGSMTNNIQGIGHSKIIGSAFKSFKFSPMYDKDYALDFLKEIADRDPAYFLNLSKLEDSGRDSSLQKWKGLLHPFYGGGSHSEKKEGIDQYHQALERLSLIQKNLYSSKLFKDYIYSLDNDKESDEKDPRKKINNFLEGSVVLDPDLHFYNRKNEFDPKGLDTKGYSDLTPTLGEAYGAIAPLIAEADPFYFLKNKMHKVFPDLSQAAFSSLAKQYEGQDYDDAATFGINDRREGELSLVETLIHHTQGVIFEGPGSHEYLSKFINKYPKAFIGMMARLRRSGGSTGGKGIPSDHLDTYLKKALKAFSAKNPIEFTYMQDDPHLLLRLGLISMEDAEHLNRLRKERNLPWSVPLRPSQPPRDSMLAFYKNLTSKVNEAEQRKADSYPSDLLPEGEAIEPLEVPIGEEIEGAGDYGVMKMPRAPEDPSLRDLWRQDTEREEAEQERSDQKLISEQEEQAWDDILDEDDIAMGRAAPMESRVAELSKWLRKNGYNKESRMLHLLIKGRQV
mgnify:CR=1 FL=1